MNLHSLEDLLIHELKDLHSAEKQLVEALPRLAKAATHPELRKAFEEHLEQTRMHVQRIEDAFENLEGSPRGQKCKGMEGLVEEGKHLLEANTTPDVLDAGLIGAAQRVEHYEIAGYGTALAYARRLGKTDIAALLKLTLDEEKVTDERLSRLAEQMINADAIGG